MSQNSPLFTVVIASLCDEARANLLQRACRSVRAMAGSLDYSILVVANGARVSQGVLDWLSVQPDVRVVRLRSGSHPLARRVGAELANSEFVAFLDDDDELLPHTLERKLAYFREHPDVDVLVTDGLCVNGTAEHKIFPPPKERCDDLVLTMMRAGWGACALTLRSKGVDLGSFDAELRHMEWTLTALELARRYKVGLLDEVTYRYYETTPNSLSKSREHNIAAPEVWRRLSKSYAGTRYESAVRKRYGTACHTVSWAYALQGDWREAWHFHFESLRCPGGLAFAFFSAKLLIAPLRRLFARNGSPRVSARSQI